ncbi:hypothetical protein R3P38DRAFT_3252205 [Favolaschia claudopus]|uniref:F-box domain-containing protein n=1 Tax=Favolaschia claudopus TaxID=2862362 RepID=A0AAW0E4A5_9AGAR
MHRCWEVSEIARKIVGAFPPDPPKDNGSLPWRQNRETLLRLAMSCRLLSEPALDLLWKKQISLQNLLKLLPTNLTLKIPIESSTPHGEVPCWKRFLFYSYRIRDIQISDRESEMLHPLRSAPVNCIFPNILSIEWNITSPDTILHPELLLGPRLISVSLNLGYMLDFSEYAPLLLFMAVHNLSLEELKVFTHIPSGDAARDFSEAFLDAIFACIIASKHLHSLRIPHLTEPMFRHLATVPHLRSLTFTHFRKFKVPHPRAQQPQLHRTIFPSLESLAICANRLHDGVHELLLNSATDIPLKHLECIANVASSQEALHDIFAALPVHCSTGQLTGLTLWCESLALDDPETDPIGLQIYSPILRLRNLRHLRLKWPTGVALDDNVCSSMAEAWPYLITLKFYANPNNIDPDSTPSLNITSLSAFARHCPHLFALQLSLDAARLAESDLDAARFPFGQTTLGFLKVMYSTIEDPQLVARFLRAIFPALRILDPTDNSLHEENGHSSMSARWREVQTLLAGSEDENRV